MAEKLKDLYFTRSFIDNLAQAIECVYAGFDGDRFARLVFDGAWETRELKERMHHVSSSLHATLPNDYPEALAILIAVAPSFRGLDAMVLPDYVAHYGLDHWTLSLPALGFFTKFGSSEFAVRPFLARDPERALEYVRVWAEDEDEHVRRLSSEGSRPRLPWAMALTAFKSDPSPILPVLEKLKDDPSSSVRRSVANNLNDISKDHPDIVLEICERWYGQSERTDWIAKHACRGMLKAGNRRALLLFGFGDPAAVGVENLTVDEDSYCIGDDLRYGFELTVGTEKPCKVRVELGVYYVKANGKRLRKVFQVSQGHYDPGKHLISRKLSLADRSTRKHYPGEHGLSIIVNGVEMAKVSFELGEGPPTCTGEG